MLLPIVPASYFSTGSRKTGCCDRSRGRSPLRRLPPFAEAMPAIAVISGLSFTGIGRKRLHLLLSVPLSDQTSANDGQLTSRPSPRHIDGIARNRLTTRAGASEWARIVHKTAVRPAFRQEAPTSYSRLWHPDGFRLATTSSGHRR